MARFRRTYRALFEISCPACRGVDSLVSPTKVVFPGGRNGIEPATLN